MIQHKRKRLGWKIKEALKLICRSIKKKKLKKSLIKKKREY